MGKTDTWRYFAYGGLILLAILLGITTSMGLGAKNYSNPLLAITSFVIALPVLALAPRVLPSDRRRGRTFEPLVLYIVFGIVTSIVFPVILGSKSASSSASCVSNMKQLATVMAMYELDYDERLPPASSWQDATEPYRKAEPFPRCPDSNSPVSYAMNTAVSGKSVEKLSSPSETVLLFEADAQLPNAHGGKEWFVRRHNGSGSIGYADGHAKRVNEFLANKAWWRP